MVFTSLWHVCQIVTDGANKASLCWSFTAGGSIKLNPIIFFYSTQYNWADYYWSVDSSCGSPGQIYITLAGLHLIQTDLFWFHLTKEFAANVNQASLAVWSFFLQWVSSGQRATQVLLVQCPSVSDQSSKHISTDDPYAKSAALAFLFVNARWSK